MTGRKKGIVALLVVMMLALVVSACGGNGSGGAGAAANEGANEGTGASADSGAKPDDGKTYTIKIGHVLEETYHYTDGAKKFKELVEERSNGRIKVEIFPASQLGDEREMLEGMRMGTVEMGIISSGPVSGFVPEFSLLDLGYLFPTNEIAQKVLKGPIGDELNDKMIAAGFRRLSYLDAGYRNVYAKKAIQTPDDLKGMKIRTLETPAQIDLFKALGAAPTPMGYSELYTSLQQGVIDAAENVPEAFYSSRHFEVAKEYSETKHFYLTMMYLISEKFYQSLPEDLQKIVADASVEAADYENGLIKQIQADVYTKMEAEGVTIHKIDDLTPFIDIAKQSWVKSAESVPGGKELLDRILQETGQTLE